ELANGYDALYMYHGAANFVNDMIDERGLEHIDGALHDNDGNLFKRESLRQATYNSYLQFEAVYDDVDAQDYDIKQEYQALPFMKKSDKITGEPAYGATIAYATDGQNTVTFDYDEGNETYTRFNDQQQTVELDSEEPVQVSNVFIIATR